MRCVSPRNQADYDMVNTAVETLAMARDMAETAREAIEILDQFAADPARRAFRGRRDRQIQIKDNHSIKWLVDSGVCPFGGPGGSEHGNSGPRLDPRPRRRHRSAIAQLRASHGAARDGRRGRAGDRDAQPPDRRGRHRGGQELRLPGPGDPGHGQPQHQGRRLDAHDRAPGTIAEQGHPVPPLGDAAGVLGGAGQGPVELHQPATAQRGHPAPGRALPAARGVRPARHDPDVVGPDPGRQPLRPGLPAVAHRLGSHPERGRQLPGPRVPQPPGVLLLQGPAADAIGQRAGRQPRAVRRRPGAAGRRIRTAAGLPGRDDRRGAHPRGGRRRAPRLAIDQPGGRLHAVAALQRADAQGPPGDQRGATPRSTRRSNR